MTTVKLVPNNGTTPTINISSKAYSVITLCLAAYDIFTDVCTCGDCQPCDTSSIEQGNLSEICEALADICPMMINAGLRDIAVETAFLLTVLPSSGGMRVEKTGS